MGLSTGDGLNERKESVTVGRVCVCSDGSESRYRDELGESAKFMKVPFDKASVSESDSESLITTIRDEHMFISAIQHRKTYSSKDRYDSEGSIQVVLQPLRVPCELSLDWGGRCDSRP
ncbi:hypothetical protein PHLCEN_2v1916 [Hermanssonia centrifuga]|uniref:Uncharacterized protein n=1 Tax=Hermanssonia centrifuga TaxID=98765 RepID=A0A2R6RVF3_9APHY|nr:hypothetical protein PHLCEN_2v1916 [Hermanssonia centrifuga]